MSKQKEHKSKPLRCKVVSEAMEKSRVGVVERLVKHPRYKKYLRRTTKIMFHDANNESKKGDLVLVDPCRPMSARKHFILKEVLQSGA